MPDPIIQFGHLIKRYQAIFSLVAGLLVIGIGGAVAWQEVKADTEAMRDRIKSIEAKVEHDARRTQEDHDLLIRIDANVQAMGERLKRIEGSQ